MTTFLFSIVSFQSSNQSLDASDAGEMTGAVELSTLTTHSASNVDNESSSSADSTSSV